MKTELNTYSSRFGLSTKQASKQSNKIHADTVKSSWSFEKFVCSNFLSNWDNVSCTSASGYESHCHFVMSSGTAYLFS